MSARLRKLLEERKIMKARITKERIQKEIAAAQSDLDDARDSLEQQKLKWATMQGYYSMFHSARSLLYSKGYREKSHYALSVAIEELFARDLGMDAVNALRNAMDLRQEADYGLKFSIEGARETNRQRGIVSCKGRRDSKKGLTLCRNAAKRQSNSAKVRIIIMPNLRPLGR